MVPPDTAHSRFVARVHTHRPELFDTVVTAPPQLGNDRVVLASDLRIQCTSAASSTAPREGRGGRVAAASRSSRTMRPDGRGF